MARYGAIGNRHIGAALLLTAWLVLSQPVKGLVLNAWSLKASDSLMSPTLTPIDLPKVGSTRNQVWWAISTLKSGNTSAHVKLLNSDWSSPPEYRMAGVSLGRAYKAIGETDSALRIWRQAGAIWDLMSAAQES